MAAHSLRVQVMVLLSLVFLGGCREQPTPTPPTPNSTGKTPDPKQPVGEPFDETKGYLHKPSGVGFVYPEGWENLGVRAQESITSLGLRKRDPKLEVTLYWTGTAPDTTTNETTIGQVEYEGLQPLYGTKVNKPAPIQAGTRSGFKLLIDGPPPGITDPNAAGVVYVFAVQRDNKWWKIKLRATVGDRENLSTVEPLLQQYRW